MSEENYSTDTGIIAEDPRGKDYVKKPDPNDIEAIRLELKKDVPYLSCNIWGYIKELEERIKVLESK